LAEKNPIDKEVDGEDSLSLPIESIKKYNVVSFLSNTQPNIPEICALDDL
jgi:hypothetical protein